MCARSHQKSACVKQMSDAYIPQHNEVFHSLHPSHCEAHKHHVMRFAARAGQGACQLGKAGQGPNFPDIPFAVTGVRAYQKQQLPR